VNVNIKNVAKLAGVHPSTVSRVINNDSRISEKTKEKVLFIINKLDYTPNAIARGLKTKRTYTIGMLIPNITNPFYAEIVRGIENAANKSRFNVILCNSDDKLEKEILYLNILKEKRVDGLILGTAHVKDRSILELEKKNFPYILVSCDIAGLDKNCVIMNDIAGGTIATEYLIKLGHRKIAHITGPLEVRSAINRLEGYMIALEKNHIKYKEELIVEGDFRIAGGYKAMKKLLKLSEMPTAIFAANDLVAMGVMQAIQQKKYHIPKDFCIVGFDDIQLASFVHPPLTTVRQPTLEMGELAVKMLLRIIEKGEFNQKKVILKPELIVRKSCRKLNN